MSEFLAKEAKREQVTLKAAFQGPSGSGKTLSALHFAKGMVGGDMSKVFLIDTENRSALMYADREGLVGWKHIDFNPPFSPERYIAAMGAAESQGAELIIIDSISHEWDGKGGCLEIQKEIEAGQKFGNSFTAWGKITPRHNAFVEKVLQSPAHVVATIRAKTEYAMQQNDKGKTEVKKLGMKGIQRDGMDYEFSIVFEVNVAHYAEATKDRTGIFMPRGPFIITEQAGKDFLNWSNSGSKVEVTRKAGATKVDVYTAEDQQKLILASIAKEASITERSQLKELSDFCMNKPMSDLRSLIGNYLATGGL